MKIALNTIAFIPGRMGGVETYFRRLLDSLQEVDTANEYSLLVDSHYADEFPLSNPRFKGVKCNFTEPSFLWFLRGVVRNTVKLDILKPVLNRLPVDVLHHPFSILNPPGLKIPSVLTFHDMQHEFFPEFFSGAEMRTRREFSRKSAREATRIIAISEHVKSSLVDRYQVSPDRIDVVYNGYGAEYRVIEDGDELARAKAKHGLDRPFIYFPAATWPHKNHKGLLAAMRILVDRYGFDGDLVLTGVAKKSHDHILGEVERLGLSERVKILGYLPYADLPCLYNLARLLVFPSLFEGFGLPLVEAMACGCPVACSDVTAIPEVVGDAGLLFDPTSGEDIAEKVWAAWNDEGLREQLMARGFLRARLFQWEKTARETIEVYRKTLETSAAATGASVRGGRP
jgi:glycosyltransferase involved in cell wall biosynthesis